MKGILFFFGFFLSLQFAAQDKIYLLNGQKLEGKVIELSSEKITYQNGSESCKIDVKLVLLIEFFDGRTQIFNSPGKDLYQPAKLHPERKTGNPGIILQNEFSINTLSLFNSDVSLYYEYRLNPKKLGLGVIGTYNFNQYATSPNAFIAVLSNGKKLYDAGAFINFYMGNIYSKHNGFFGLMLKYTAFTFSAVKEDSVYNNNTLTINISYKAARSYQLSTLFIMGLHSSITENLFIKPSLSFGFFFLNSLYKQQFNYLVSDPQSGNIADYSVLPKASLNICVGLSF
jgi:hypothetical protein